MLKKSTCVGVESQRGLLSCFLVKVKPKVDVIKLMRDMGIDVMGIVASRVNVNNGRASKLCGLRI
jgi:hypothetical protein